MNIITGCGNCPTIGVSKHNNQLNPKTLQVYSRLAMASGLATLPARRILKISPRL